MNQITDQLWLGDIRDAQTKPLRELGIDTVVTICQDSVEDNVSGRCDYYHFNLADGKPTGHNPGTEDYTEFAGAVDVIRNAIAAGDTVFVHCHAGQSRSVSAAACVLACDHGFNINEAYQRIRAHRETHVSPDLRTLANKYVSRNARPRASAEST